MSISLPMDIAGQTVPVANAAALPPTASVPIGSIRTTLDNGHLWQNTTSGWVDVAAVGTGTVTSVSVVTANGVSGSVANPSSTPAITLSLGAITPSSVAASGAVTGSNLSGTNTGNQTITLTGDVTGSGTGSFAATIAALAVTNAKIANSTIDLTTKVTGVLPVVNGGANNVTEAGITIDGAGLVIATGLRGAVTIAYSGVINAWTLLADQSGSIVIDVWKTDYAGYPGNSGNSIAGTDLPTISSAQKNRNLTLSAWTSTTVTAGDILYFNVNSATSITRANLVLTITKT